ncbi:DUF6355 family natural product biosynthesis protein [Amycolatopsis sp. MEPSY49]|uniref:DUF6355 family natural product biosynthesis protein n=1 Tax=Amycolatopsis sp. MEPSY49 TaxID=3151600 RepID=UPI003EF3D226
MTRSSTLRRPATIVAAALLTMATSAGIAAATELAPKPCGYSESDGHSWYNHCTSDGSLIVIKIDEVLQKDRWYCVAPGVTYLAASVNTRGAWYTGEGCNKVGPL